MNGSIVLVARSQLRRRWRAVVLLTLFVGVVGGLSISLVAGARRSATVVDRYFGATIPYDLQLGAPSLSRDDVQAIPGVVRADPEAYVAAVVLSPGGAVVDGVNAIAMDRDAIDPTIDVLDGAVPDAGDSFSVLVNEAFVDDFGATSGDEVDVQMFGLDQEEEVSNGIYEPDGPRYRFRVAGVVRTPMDIATDKIESPTGGAYADANMMALPLALLRGAPPRVPRLRRRLRRPAHRRAGCPGGVPGRRRGPAGRRRDRAGATGPLQRTAGHPRLARRPRDDGASWPWHRPRRRGHGGRRPAPARRAADARRRHGRPSSAGLHATRARGRRHAAQPARRRRRHDRRRSPGRGVVRVVSGRHRRPARARSRSRAQRDRGARRRPRGPGSRPRPQLPAGLAADQAVAEGGAPRLDRLGPGAGGCTGRRLRRRPLRLRPRTGGAIDLAPLVDRGRRAGARRRGGPGDARQRDRPALPGSPPSTAGRGTPPSAT